jgi:beta-glucosidase
LQATVGDVSSTVVDARTQLENALAIRSIDRAAQEDAQQFTWSGQNIASVTITGPPTDYTVALHYDMALAIQYRVDKAPEGQVTLAIACGDTCQNSLDITQLFLDTTPGEWSQTTIPLRHLATAEADMSKVTALVLETSASFSISVSDIRLVPKN